MNQEKIKEYKCATLRVSKLPKHIQETAAKLDTNQDGELEAEEVIGAITDLQKTEKTNQNLKKTIAVFVVLTAVLVSGVFGASVAAARLAKDVTIEQDTGFAIVKGSSTKEVMKTQEAIVYRKGVSIGGMSNQELANLKVLSLQDGDLQFEVKGYARNSIDGTVMLLVEGGTLTYNNEGIASSTGDARLLLEATFGADVHVEGSDGQRRLGRGGTTDAGLLPDETQSESSVTCNTQEGTPTGMNIYTCSFVGDRGNGFSCETQSESSVTCESQEGTPDGMNIYTCYFVGDRGNGFTCSKDLVLW